MNKKKDDFLIEEMKQESKNDEQKDIFIDFDMFIIFVRIIAVLMVCYGSWLLFESTFNDLREFYNDANFETETVDTATNKNNFDANDFLTDYYAYRYFLGE